MVSPLFFYKLVLVALVWLCVMLHWAWPSDPAAVCPTTPEPPGPLPKHNREPTTFAGLTCKPPCAACEQAHDHVSQPPGCPPPRIVPTRGRPRQVATSFHFCPNATCDSSFQETHGTPLHGKRVAPEKLVWAMGALADGLGIRAVARVFAVDPNTVLAWLVEVAEHVAAFSQVPSRPARSVRLRRSSDCRA